MREIKTIALVEWNWIGHHPNYFAHFASALLENGVRVLPLCSQPDDLRALLAQTPAGKSGKYANLLEDTLPISFPPHRNIRPARFRPVEQAIRHFGDLGRRLRRWEKMRQSKIDLVFFSCIYDVQFEWFRYAEPLFHFPWSGLYLHARSFRMPGTLVPYAGRLPCPEKIFSRSSLHSVGILDEGAIQPLQKITKGKPVVAFPDFTDTSLPLSGDPAWGLANKLREFARGRSIVSLVGHLQRTKGLEEFTRAAQDDSLRGMCFFLGGEVNWLEINDVSRQTILRAWEQSPNIFTHLQRISEEKTINALMVSSDIIFAAYTDFPNSSGILTKAAIFERPAIVSDGYLMAERTRFFRLGEVVPEGDVDAIIASLKRLGTPGQWPNLHSLPKWTEYKAVHSYERLKSAFVELLGTSSPH